MKRAATTPAVYGDSAVNPNRPSVVISGLRLFAFLSGAAGVVTTFNLMREQEWFATVWLMAGLVSALLLSALASHLELTAEIAESVLAARRDLQSLLESRRTDGGD